MNLSKYRRKRCYGGARQYFHQGVAIGQIRKYKFCGRWEWRVEGVKGKKYLHAKTLREAEAILCQEKSLL